MYFTDMCFSEEEHTDTGLADAAADSIWKFFVKDCFLEALMTNELWRNQIEQINVLPDRGSRTG